MIGRKSQKETKAVAAPVPATASSTTLKEILSLASLENTIRKVVSAIVSPI